MLPPRPLPYHSWIELLDDKAARSATQLLYTFLDDSGAEEGRMTQGDLARRARQIAGALQQVLKPGDRAVLLYSPGLEYIAGFLGCLYANVVAVPAFPPDPARLNRTLPRLQSIIQDSQAQVVLTVSFIAGMAEAFAEHAPELRALRWIATDELPAGTDTAWKKPEVGPETLAFLQYTSGSTGTPRGVMLSHANLMQNLRQATSQFGISTESIGAFWLPPYHDMGLIGAILSPLFLGYHAVLMSPLTFLKQPRRWLEAITRYRATLAGGPNFAYDLCVRKVSPAEREGLDLSSLENAFCGAEPIRAETVERFVSAYAPQGLRRTAFYPCYGLAEATLMVTSGLKMSEPVLRDWDSQALAQGRYERASADSVEARTLVGCGKSPDDQDLVIVSPDTLTRSPPGAVGEIWVRGPHVAQGYWNRPQESEATFQARRADTGEGPFLRTGDLGFLDKDGELFVVSRLKDLIIIRGRNHSPQDIELSVDRAHPALRPGCVAAFSVEEGSEERLVIVQEAKPLPEAELEAAVAAIRDTVASKHDLQVHAVVLIAPGSIFKTSSGKIQRRSCKAAFLDGTLSLVHQWRTQRTQEEAPKAGPAAPAERAEPDAPVSAEQRRLRQWLVQAVAEAAGISASRIDAREPFSVYGLDSAASVRLAGDLERLLGRTFPPTLVWEHPTIEALARHLAQAEAGATTALAERAATEAEPIAIIGMGCRFPRASGLEAYWKLLVEGTDAIIEVPPDRWDAREYYDADPGRPGKMTTRWGGFVEGLDGFDRGFFGLSPREASRMDPQQRMLLEVTWEALEDAGVPADRLAGTPTGVFVGISTNDYGALQRQAELSDAYAGTGNALSIAANRLSYVLDLKGPSMAVDTACSSSLVAVHLACRSLRSGESSLAIAAGVNVLLSPDITVNFTKAGFMAPDGRCKPFDSRANGYVRSEGTGAVLLKPLSRALADGDRVYAVIRGSSVNHGGRSNGLTAPNRQAQEAVLREAYLDAGVSPGQVQYVEAHGTGTALGDPIEAAALGAVLSQDRPAGSLCAIGSVKSNLGHLESAAGIAGLIKVALSLHHQQLPATLHFQQPNPHIPFAQLPLRVQQALEPWPTHSGQALAGVSAFGFGGTNAHVVLANAPAASPAPGSRAQPEGLGREHRTLLLPLSARGPAALRALVERTLAVLPTDEARLEALCVAASVRRSHHSHRLALVGRDASELRSQAQAFLTAEPKEESLGRPSVAFIFSGQGAQWWGMGRGLLAREPLFRQAFEQCEAIVKAEAGWSLLAELAADEASSRLAQTEYVQPILAALQVSLAALWRGLGIHPDFVVGHSVGEIAAAHVAGALSLEQALRLAVHRGRVMQRATGQGKMALVTLTPEEARRALAGYEGRLSLAAHNAPASTVISGEPAALEEVLATLRQRGVQTRALPVDYAFHSPQVEPLREDLTRTLSFLTPSTPSLPVVSTLTGKPVEGIAFDAAYWARQMREPVLFAPALQHLVEQGCQAFIEVAPHPVLTADVSEVLRGQQRTALIVPSMRRKEDERRVLLTSLGALYRHGAEIAWDALHPGIAPAYPLPTYPWQHERSWLETSRAERLTRGGSKASRLLGHHLATATGETHLWELHLAHEDLGSLADHRLQGHWVMPATGYVEMMLAAAAEVLGSGARTLEEVLLRSPLTLNPDEARTLQVAFTLAGDRATLRVHSAPAPGEPKGWTLHATGTLRLSPSPAEAHERLEVLRARCPRELGSAGLYQALMRGGLEYGPAFQGLGQVWLGNGEALGRVELPAGSAEEAQNYQFSPALLDSALQVLGATLQDRAGATSGLAMPTALGRVRVLRKPGKVLWSHARLRPAAEDLIEGDVQLFDEEGALLAEVRGLRLRKLEEAVAASESLADWMYETRWQPDTSEAAPDAGIEGWLVLADQGHVGQALAEALKARGQQRVVLAAAKSPVQPLLERSLAKAKPGSWRVVDLRGLDVAQPGAALELGGWPLITLAQQLATLPASGAARLWVVTRGAQPSGKEGVVAPAQAALWGAGRTLAWEHPELWGGLVDVDPRSSDEDVAAALASFLVATGQEDQVVLRRGTRSVARLARRRELASLAAPRQLRPEACYLITGGLGALGLRMARWMVEAGARRLILMSRTGLPPRSRWAQVASGSLDAERITAVRELEALGASVHVAKVDVANEAALAASLEALREQWPEVRGVVHAAGVLRDASVLQLTAEAVEAVAAPKALGAWALHRALADAPLDFFILFSSAASLLGSPGQASYAAANAFLDALAHARRAQGLPALSISWGPWAEVGMAATTRRKGSLAQLGMRSLAPERATEALAPLLASGSSHAGVLSVRWSALRQPAQARPFLALLQHEPSPSTQAAGGRQPLRASLASADDAARRRLIEDFLRAEAAASLGMEPALIAPTEALTMLGFDSIMALELRNRVQAQLPVQLPMVALLQTPTLKSLTAELLRLLPSAEASEAAQGPVLAQRGPEEGAPLSFSQERVWFLTHLNPETSAYNLGGALRLEGTLDRQALERTFTELVRRHEVLRATFPEELGRPVQRLLPPAPVTIPVVDLTHLPSAEREAEARRLAEEVPRRPFELAHGPLLRVTLLRLSEREHVLVVGMHHIISDAWSMMAVLVQEVAALYSAFVTGRTPELSPLPVQYADYAAWERRWLEGERLKGQVEFWRQQLAGAPEALELPTDHPRPAVQTYRGARHELALPASVMERLRALSAQEGATLFMTALAALNVLLMRLSGQQDISVGASVANRSRSELEGLIGLFTNALVLRTDLSGDPTFRQLLARVRQVTLDAYAHQEVPFGKLVEELQPVRSLSRSPFFQVVLLMQNNPMPEVNLPGLTLRGMEGDSGTGQYELTLELWDRPEGVRGWLIYNTDLFEPTTIALMGEELATLLAGIAESPDRPLSALPLLSERERRKLLVDWNATHAPFPSESSAHQLFEAQVRLRPDAVAVGARERSLTYRQLNALANRAARALVERGVKADVVVPLLSERTPELLASMLAISKAGGAYLPLDPLYPAPRLAQVLQQSRASLIVTSRELHPVVERTLALLGPGRRLEVLTIEDLLAAAQPEDDLPPRSAPNSLAYVIFTSGSTGVPKGAMVEHRGMVNHLMAKSRDLGITGKDVVAQTAAQNFDIFVFQNITALVMGARTQIVAGEDALNPARLLEEVRRHGITVLNIVPTQLRSLVEELTRTPASLGALASLRWMVPTGESLPPELCREWMELLPSTPLLNAYGHTECSDDQAHYVVRRVPEGASTPIGTPIQNLHFYVLDKHLQPLPIGATGELFIGGVGVGRGYLADPGKTAEKFIPHPFSDEPGARLYRTGDLGRWRSDGLLEVLGRMDFMVKLRGFRVELGEVEAALSRHPAVRDAVAMVRQDTPGVQRLVAYVVARGGQPAPTSAELRDFLRESLPEHMVPSACVLLEALPLTANGKVDRKALPSPSALSPEGEHFEAPRTPTQQVLASIWAQVLGLERVGAHDHFFELGGHSLLATQVMARAREAFQVELPLREFFETPTLSGLAQRLDAAKGAGKAPQLSPLVPVPREGAMPLSFAQQRMWFLDQLEPKSAFYNIAGAIRLEGQLNVDALSSSFQEVVSRHEALRTTFRNEKGTPLQEIWPAPHLPLPVVDVSAVSPSQRTAEVDRLAATEARTPFDLAAGPLLRVKLLRLGPSPRPAGRR